MKKLLIAISIALIFPVFLSANAETQCPNADVRMSRHISYHEPEVYNVYCTHDHRITSSFCERKSVNGDTEEWQCGCYYVGVGEKAHCNSPIYTSSRSTASLCENLATRYCQSVPMGSM